MMVRVLLPPHLRVLARCRRGDGGREVRDSALSAGRYRGSLPDARGNNPRSHDEGVQRAFLRFFACEQDLSHESPDTPLPEAVVSGKEPLLVIGAVAGG